jgi:hypothetical protein
VKDSGQTVTPARVGPPRPKARLEPIDARRYALRMTVGPEFMTELAEVKSALSHLVPDGNLEAVLRVCFQKTLETCARRKRAAVSTPPRPSARSVAPAEVSGKPARRRPSRRSAVPMLSDISVASESQSSTLDGPAQTQPVVMVDEASRSSEHSVPAQTLPLMPIDEASQSSTGGAPAQGFLSARVDERGQSRGVPSEVRRAVWARDEGRCAFIGATGRRCGSTHQLEFDHVEPFAHGGASTVANLRVVCRAHNQHLGRVQFGERHMARFRSGVRQQASTSPVSDEVDVT